MACYCAAAATPVMLVHVKSLVVVAALYIAVLIYNELLPHQQDLLLC